MAWRKRYPDRSDLNQKPLCGANRKDMGIGALTANFVHPALVVLDLVLPTCMHTPIFIFIRYAFMHFYAFMRFYFYAYVVHVHVYGYN